MKIYFKRLSKFYANDALGRRSVEVPLNVNEIDSEPNHSHGLLHEVRTDFEHEANQEITRQEDYDGQDWSWPAYSNFFPVDTQESPLAIGDQIADTWNQGAKVRAPLDDHAEDANQIHKTEEFGQTLPSLAQGEITETSMTALPRDENDLLSRPRTQDGPLYRKTRTGSIILSFKT